jgi:hypothetical protein
MADRHGNGSSLAYQEYSSQDPELNIMMEYPSDWRFREHRGSYGSYAQVQFYGAVQGDFAPSIVLTVEPASKVAFRPLTIQGLADDLVEKRMHFEDTNVLSRAETELLGLPAVDLTLAYKQPSQLRSLEFDLVPFQERIIVFQKDDRFYTFRYMNTEKEFRDFEAAFLQGIKTLQLKSKGVTPN